MIIIYPVGHDQETYSRPWFTWGVIATCALVFFWMRANEDDRTVALLQAAVAFEEARTTYPTAGLSQEQVAQAPPILQRALSEFVDDEAPAAEAVDEAVTHLIVAARALPTQRLGYVPADGNILRAFTSLFAHGGWMHIIGNMLLLVLIGSILEGFWRLGAYIALYLGAGLVGVIVHHLADPQSPAALIGASGAIAGCIAALLFGFARTRITLGWLVWIFVYVRAGTVRMPVWVLAPLWGALQILDFASDRQDGVAYGAHVGGFLFGLAFAFAADKLGWIARDGGHV
jgi:membrane associated rhomboid family serine protease